MPCEGIRALTLSEAPPPSFFVSLTVGSVRLRSLWADDSSKPVGPRWQAGPDPVVDYGAFLEDVQQSGALREPPATSIQMSPRA